jgi:hypothetical protein
MKKLKVENVQLNCLFTRLNRQEIINGQKKLILTCPCSYTDDKKRDNIDPDKLKNGITKYPSPEDKEILYMFFARYVQKVHSDGAIKSELRNNEGM